MQYRLQNETRNKKQIVRPRRIRELYAALGTALDETQHPLIAAHWGLRTRQMILRQITAAELDFGTPANDNRRAGQ